MAEPRLSLVDRVFDQLPEPTDDLEKKRRAQVKAVVAKYIPSAIKLARPAILEEGRQDALRKLGVQRIEEASMIADLRAQHAENVSHLKEQFGRGSLYKGMCIMLAFTLIAVIPMTAFATYRIYQSGLLDDVATQRVPRAGVPSIQYEAPATDYTHDRQEPGDAD